MGGNGGCCVTNSPSPCCIVDIPANDAEQHGVAAGNVPCAEAPEISPQDANIQQIAKIANEVAEFQGRAKNQCDHLDGDLSIVLEQSSKAIVEWIAANGDAVGNEVAEKVKGIFHKLQSDITGFYYAYMEERLLVTNSEWSVILAERDDEKRQKNSEAFYVRNFRHAAADVNSKIETAFRQVYEAVTEDASLPEKLAHEAWQVTQRECDAICAKFRDYIQKSKEEIPDNALRLKDIAERFGWEIGGNGDFEVHSICYADEAKEDSLAVIYSDREAKSTMAGAVLTAPRLMDSEVNFIRCGFGEIGGALAKVARMMVEEGICPDYEKRPAQINRDGAMVGEECRIGVGTVIEPFASIGDHVTIGKNCRIGSGVFIGSGCEIGDDVTILAGSRIGVNCHYHYEEKSRHWGFAGIGRTIIQDGAEIGANTVIQRGSISDTIIGKGTVIGNLVEIAHDVKIGDGCLIVSQVGICGNAVIGNRVQIYGQAGIAEWVRIGDAAVILAKSAVTKNLKAGVKVSGMFARDHREELRRLAKNRRKK
ncbi:MAG: hypothetical protein IKO94_05260 [Selenomonadaceae bacterium]|nr:hypothetical protein [Selenomonadaceae bacterium]